MQEEQKINNLEKDMLQLKSAVDFQSQILVEVKQILHEHKNILQNITAVRESINSLRHDLDNLENIFDTRKEVTDNNNKNFSDFVSKFKGGLAVFLFLFGTIQAIVGFILQDNYETHKIFQKEVQELHIQNAVIKEKLKNLNLDKSLQDALVSKTNK